MYEYSLIGEGFTTKIGERLLMDKEELLQTIEQAAGEEATSLDLSGRDLGELPEEIGQLTHLTELRLARNQLTALPPEIGQLTNLTRLYLAGNQLTSLPEEIGQLTNLSRLALAGNPLGLL